MTDSCSTCDYARPMNAGLECHRQPPQIVVLPGSSVSLWPLVLATDWCGEYQPNEQRMAEQGA